MKKITRRSCLKNIALAVAAAGVPLWLRTRPIFAADPGPQPQPTDDEAAAIAAIAAQFMAQYQVPGLSVAIARHGQFVYKQGFGFADVDKREKVTPAHRFRIASVTKPITSTTIFSLIEQGKFALDDLVFGRNGLLHFDYAKAYPGQVEAITLHHLLTHTGGGWEKGKNDPMFENPAMNHQQLIEWAIRTHPLEFAPGAHYGYSNFGYCLLGRVIEKVTGQPYAAYVKKNILAKCGITTMQIAGNTLESRAPGEVTYYGNGSYTMNVSRMDSHGGWIATASDLVQFLMHVDGFDTTPNILLPDTIKAMTAPGAVNPGYGCGWCLNKWNNRWHNGSLPGTTTIMVRTAKGLCWAALANIRTKDIDGALDSTMWKMAKAVPEWQA